MKTEKKFGIIGTFAGATMIRLYVSQEIAQELKTTLYGCVTHIFGFPGDERVKMEILTKDPMLTLKEVKKASLMRQIAKLQKSFEELTMV